MLGMMATGKSGYQIPSRRKFLWNQLSLGRGTRPVPQHSKMAQEGPKHFVGDWSSKTLAWLLTHQLEDLVLGCWGHEGSICTWGHGLLCPFPCSASWRALPCVTAAPPGVLLQQGVLMSKAQCQQDVHRIPPAQGLNFMPGLCSGQLTFEPGWGWSPPWQSTGCFPCGDGQTRTSQRAQLCPLVSLTQVASSALQMWL